MGSASETGRVRFASRSGEVVFDHPVALIHTRELEGVLPCLAQVESAVAHGLHAAGFLAYEAAAAFDPALVTHPPGASPLLWFGLYSSKTVSPSRGVPGEAPEVGDWRPLVSEEQYRAAIAGIREFLAAGDTYQVNYTFPLCATFRGDPLPWFWQLCQAQRADHCAFVDAGRFCVLSASPELFFRLERGRIETRPMKGTRRRGRWLEEDRRLAEELAASAKEQAENVMIVDLLRNDMGRIAETGSVDVVRLFEVERYETVWQMTSTIAARTRASVPQILAALFPSGSVTGAPKVRTMQIIQALEPFPRGVYCGAIGWWSPGPAAEFNVAIRTVTVDRETDTAEYHVGGGITVGSTAEGEYEECRVKAVVLTAPTPRFALLESLLFDGEYFLLEEHLARLRDSATYFDYAVDVDAVRQELMAHAAVLGDKPGPHKVRLLVARDGVATVEAEPAGPVNRVRVGFAAEPVDDRDRFLYHKTTYRAVYDRAKASRPDCDEVLLWNKRGEITESTRANIVLDIGGALLTPPVTSGLLAGTMRAHLLQRGEIREATLTKEDVHRAQSIRLINSVRRWIDVDFVDAP